MNTTMKTLSALTIAAATLTAASLAASSNAWAQVHGRTTVSVTASVHPGSPGGRLSPVKAAGVAPVATKAACRDSCIPWKDSIWHAN